MTITPMGTSLATDDAELIERTRAGDGRAYGELYERHQADVERLARRLSRHRLEADDVVSEVFAKTLRAIRNGHGPVDDALPYLLRSVRHTLVHARTSGDGARATPTDHDRLDAIGSPTHLREQDPTLAEAFAALPPNFREVLWATEVAGFAPSDIADGDRSPSAVTSLTHRARCALRRSYLTSRTHAGSCVTDACRAARRTMPAIVLGEAAASTVDRVERHVDACASCNDILADLRTVAARMPHRSLLGLVALWGGRFLRCLVPKCGSSGLAVPAVAIVGATAGVALAGAVAHVGDEGARTVEQAAVAPLVELDMTPDRSNDRDDPARRDADASPASIVDVGDDETSRPSPIAVPRDDATPPDQPTRGPKDRTAGADPVPSVPLAVATTPDATGAGDVPIFSVATDGVTGDLLGDEPLQVAVDLVGDVGDEAIVIVDEVVDALSAGTENAIDTAIDTVEPVVTMGVSVVDPVVDAAVAPVDQALDDLTATGNDVVSDVSGEPVEDVSVPELDTTLDVVEDRALDDAVDASFDTADAAPDEVVEVVEVVDATADTTIDLGDDGRLGALDGDPQG